MTYSLRDNLIAQMKAVFGDDRRRINHALKVLEYAETLLAGEDGDRDVVTAAAILHDIGIHAAQAKHHSTAGIYQQIEGPPIAREILLRQSLPAAAITHICNIIAEHHIARNIDTPEFRIIWDADWLVNFPDEYPDLPPERRRERIETIFKTETGKNLAFSLFLNDS